MGIDINDPNLIEKLRAQIKEQNSDKGQIQNKIQPWLTSIKKSDLSKIEKIQKHKETIDLGTFLFYLDKKIEINEVFTESPDFIVSLNGRKIGIELKDLIIQKEEKEKESILKSIFLEIEKELEGDYEKNCGFYRIEFEESNLALKKKDRVNIKDEILSKINGLPTKSNYIKQIIKRPEKSTIHVYNGRQRL